MSVDTKLRELIINTLSPEQLPEQPSDTEIYLVEDDAEYATVEELAEKQDKADNDLATVSKTVVGAINEVRDKVQEIEAARFPNAIIIGEPTISQGQVSGFSVANYLQFPFVVDLTNRRFTAEFCFTTGDDVATQQNILDSQFGLALAISNGKGLMAISHNGTSWAGSVAGTLNIQPNTTYYAKLSWNRINYQTQLSTDGTTYTPDMNFGSTQSPYPRTMFIGGCSGTAIGHTAHPFKGTINLNKCRLYIEDVEVWQGMDDVGLATRADVSLDNLDARGEARFAAKQNKLIAGENITIDEATNTISATGGGSGDIDNTTITTNANQQIQAVAVIDQNSGIAKTWTGTMAEYEAIVTKDPETEYIITDDIGGSATVIGEITEDINDLKEHTVIEFQAPTAENGYTWYRKYADGWVEQGGYIAADTTGNVKSIALPIEMLDGNYQTSKTLSRCASTTSGFNWGYFGDKSSGDPLNTSTTAYFSVPSTSYCIGAWWQVSGMAA